MRVCCLFLCAVYFIYLVINSFKNKIVCGMAAALYPGCIYGLGGCFFFGGRGVGVVFLCVWFSFRGEVDGLMLVFIFLRLDHSLG